MVMSVRTAGDFVEQAKSLACGDIGCDPSNGFLDIQNKRNQPEGDERSVRITATMTGNYDNTQQRDYMARVLQEAFDMAQTNERDNPQAFLNSIDGRTTFIENPTVRDIPTFGQVVLNDPSGRTLAEMTIRIDASVPETQEACENSAGKIVKEVISAIPVAGALVGLVLWFSMRLLMDSIESLRRACVRGLGRVREVIGCCKYEVSLSTLPKGQISGAKGEMIVLRVLAVRVLW